MRTSRLAALTAAAVLVLAACSGGTDGAGTGDTAADSDTGFTPVAEGKLTIATSDPAYEPWVVDNDPSNGEGYESAVAYAVADELGYDADDVEWVRQTFEQIIAPGVKSYDFAINQVSITDERKSTLAFSSSYYDTAQAIVTIADSPAAGVTDLAGLKPLKIGAMVGTTSAAIVEEVVAPDAEIALFNDNDQVKQALSAGLVDAVVYDLPSALYVGNVELADIGGTVLGQLPAGSGDGDSFGLVLDIESTNVEAVTAAVDALRENGTLAELEAEWLTDAAGAPVLE